MIYNDFDGYKNRCERIAETEELRKRLYENITVNYEAKSPLKEKEEILTKLHEHQAKYGRIDMDALSAWLLFSGQSAKDLEQISKWGLYNKVPQRPLQQAEDYFAGVEIVSKDYAICLLYKRKEPYARIYSMVQGTRIVRRRV